MFLSINLISADEINDNDLNSIDSSNLVGIDSVDNTNSLSSNLMDEDLNSVDSESDAISESDNADLSPMESTANTEDADISSADVENLDVNSADVENLDVNSADVENVDVGSTNLENYSNNASNGGTNLDIYSKERVDITVSKTSIVRGTSIYIYLKDDNGKPLSGKVLTLTINKVKYTKTTNSNGAVSLPFNVLLGNYTLNVHFAGDSEHHDKVSSFLLHIYQLKTKITVSKKSVARGKYLYAFLKDSKGNPLSGEKITFKVNGKQFVETTNQNGRARLKITSKVGKYPVNIIFSGLSSYKKSSKNFTLKVFKRATKITIANKNVIRGKCLYAYLKDSYGNALKSKKVIITFNNIDFHRTTNKNGRVSLKIKTKLGTFPTIISYAGSSYYKASSKSFKLKSYVAKTKISAISSVVRGKYFYAYLKTSSNKPISGEKLVITINGKKYTKVTNSKGRAALKIKLLAKSYSVKINHAASNSYRASKKSLTLHVLTNATAKIIAKSGTYLGEYSIRLTDLKGNPLAGQTVKFVFSTPNRKVGSLKAITQKTIIIDTDVIFSSSRDNTFMKNLATALRAKGYKVIISGRGPNQHNVDVAGKYSNAVILCLLGGVDSGCIKAMSDTWYQNLLKKYNNRVVLGYLDPPNTVNLATCTWLKRAHDDNYSPSSFTGLSYPGTYLNNHGMDYIYGKSATQMANNFVNYAVKGLSIGLNNKLPSVVHTYTAVTNSAGYATIPDLPSGSYTVSVSYSDSSKGYAADSVTTSVIIK